MVTQCQVRQGHEYHAGEPASSTQGFGEVIGDWAQEMSRELNSDVGQPRKGNKDKKRYFIYCDIILEVTKEIFYML